MRTREIKILLSSILIVLSFFVWYNFWIQKNIIEIEKLNNQKYFVDLEIKKWIINISKNSNNVSINVNGETYNSWSLIIK